MKRYLLFFILLFRLSLSWAQSRYPVSQIPAELNARASAIVRNMELTIDIRGTENVTYTFKKAITILNKNGDDEAYIEIWYDKMLQVKTIKGTVLNEFGIITGKFSDKDFGDESAVSDASLFEDSRIKRFSPAVNSYPYTLEYEYEIRSKQTLSFPDWYPNSSEGVAVEKASLKVQAVPGFNIRYRETNFPGSAIKGTNKEGMSTWTWELSNQKAIRAEPFSPPPSCLLTSVQIAPEKFSYGNVGGSFSNWNEFGKWMNEKLLAGRTLISPETSTYIRSLTKDISNPKEKAKKIYEYLQQKTRYISVQVGIGGFQPMMAAEVDRLGYGDCKGLVNYMQALLRVAGINSWYSVVESGDVKKSADPTFPTINFGNHIILCLPFERDTTWLECTSKDAPFGFLSDFTDDRVVLACTPEGGKLLKTPAYTAEMNLEAREAQLSIDSTGNLSGIMKTTFTGTRYDSRQRLYNLPFSEQTKELANIYPLNNLKITTYKLTMDKQVQPLSQEIIGFKADGYAPVNGDRMFLPLNELNRMGSGAREVRNRINPVYINRGFTESDQFTYTLPAGYVAQAKPEEIALKSPFGTFYLKIAYAGNLVLYTRKLQVYEGTFTAGQYELMVNFYQEVADADHRKIILSKK